MAYEAKPLDIKEGEILIFRKTNKKKESHPDGDGQLITPDGTRYEIAVWENKSKSGDSVYLKGKIKQFGTNETQTASAQTSAKPASKKEDDMPF